MVRKSEELYKLARPNRLPAVQIDISLPSAANVLTSRASAVSKRTNSDPATVTLPGHPNTNFGVHGLSAPEGNFTINVNNKSPDQ